MPISFSSFRQPMTRTTYSMAVIWLIYGISSLEIHRSAHVTALYVFYLVATAATCVLWVFGTVSRLTQLGLSPLLILPYSAPLLLAVWILSPGPSYWAGGAMVSALAVQAPLILLPAQRAAQV
jgi:hypothetical protein